MLLFADSDLRDLLKINYQYCCDQKMQYVLAEQVQNVYY